MKKTSLMLLLLAGSFCMPVAAENRQKDAACRILDLKEAFSQLKFQPQSKEKQMAFLEAFPDSWEEFIAIYLHYDPLTGSYDRLYEQAPRYVEILKSLDQVDDARLIPHLVSLTYASSWYADAPSYLQEVLHELMAGKKDAFFAELSKRSKAAQFDFWAFYWSKPAKKTDSPYEKERKALESAMKDKYPQIVRAMSLAYEYYYGEAMPL